MDLSRYEKPEYYVNRELSWLKFDERVLSEARDKSLPLRIFYAFRPLYNAAQFAYNGTM